MAMMASLLALSLQVCGCYLDLDSERRFGADRDHRESLHTVRATPELTFFNAVEDRNYKSVDSRPGDEHLFPVRPAPVEARPIPLAIPESVFLLYRGGQDGVPRTDQVPEAAAFVLSVPDRRHHRIVRFLVTARHVVDPQWAHCAAGMSGPLNLRLNRRSGGVGFESISPEGRGGHRFVTLPDPTADIAVIRLDRTLIPNLDDYKFLEVPFRLLPTDAEARRFHEDLTVMTARIPQWQTGDSGYFPIFDAGVLTQMPLQSVGVQCGTAHEPQSVAQPLHLWFIQGGALQAIGGAPVYTAMARGPGVADTPVLLGVQAVAWPGKGVAGITPSVVLCELIQMALRKEKLTLDLYRGPITVPSQTLPSLY